MFVVLVINELTFPDLPPALLGALLVLLSALLWRLRRRERRYPPAQRVERISEALREGRDVRIVYWSKHRKRLVTEIVTPESIQGPYMKAHDHGQGITRKFKITRIKEVVVYPHPALGSALIPQESRRNVRIMTLVLLLVVTTLLYWLRYDVQRNDFTLQRTAPPRSRARPVRIDAGLSNAAPVHAREKSRSEASSSVSTNNTEVSLSNSRLLSSRAYYEQAVALNTGGDFAGAIEYCAKAIEGDLYYAQAYCLRALARIMKGDLDGAIADSTRAIELNPRYSQAYYIRGSAFEEKGRSEEAIADYNEVITINPNFSDAYNGRAWARYKKGDLEEAIEDVKRAILLDPKSANAYDTRAWTKYAKGDKDGAIADCSRAVQLDPQSVVGYNSQGLLYYITGEYSDAVQVWSSAVEMAPTARNHLEPWIEKARSQIPK